MKKLLKKISLILAFMAYLSISYAAVVPGLYNAQMPVMSRSTAERNLAIPLALQQVLIKVSGNSNVMTIPAIAAVLKNANNYVQEFNYQSGSAAGSKGLFLNVSFLPKSVNDVLQQNEQTVWSANRPLILVWIAVQDQKGTVLLHNDSNNPALQALQQDAKLRALPVIFPILDLSDMQQISPSDVWAPFLDVVMKASQRYSPDAVLIVRLDTANKNDIAARWLLLFNNEKMRWETEGGSLAEIIQLGVNDVADGLVRKLTATEHVVLQPSTVQISVTQLQGISDYTKVVQYLRRLPQVKNVQVLSVNGSEVDFELSISSDIATLQHELQAGALLQPIVGVETQDQNNNQEVSILKYQLQKSSSSMAE